jgi:hypothetical protein
MGDIYARADQTILWFGEAAHRSRLALSLIKAWAGVQKDYDAFLCQCPFALKDAIWKAIEGLSQRP